MDYPRVQGSSAGTAASLLNKVPQVTIFFWIIKVLSTTVGETGADYLAADAGLGVAATDVLMCVILAAALLVQLQAPRYVPWRYWLAVVLLSIVGTQITDALTDVLGVSLYLSTTVFTLALVLTFSVWYQRERTLSIHAIDTRGRELFYWLAILLTFALGTAAGDLASEALGLGYAVGTLCFAGLIAAIYLAFRMGANAVLCFWLAYVLTRPLGAALGDLLSQSRENGGLGFGTIFTSAVFLSVILMLVIWISMREQAGPERAAGMD